MKKSEKKVRAYFNKMGWDFDKKKPKGTGIKWEDIGEAIGLSADAARLAHSRHRLSLVDEVGYIEDLPTYGKSVKKSPARILIFDLETSPCSAYVWSMWKQNVNPLNGQLISDWFCLTWSAKWLFEDEIMSDRLTSQEVLEEDDSRIIKSIWRLISEADIIVAHNAMKFDVKRMNTRFLKHRLAPPESYEVIDTLVHARKRFAIVSNRLDYLGEFLGVGRKKDTGGFELWAKCMKGDDSALEKMSDYCTGDIALLERVYLEILPWIQPHPNLGLYSESDVPVCPSCGSSSLKWGDTYYTTMNSYEAFSCGDCGSKGRKRKSNTPKDVKKRLTSSLPK